MAYEVDYDKHNARGKDAIRTDIMTTCFHVGVDAKGTARVLFAAGMKATKAENVQKFFDGRQKWLDKKAADKKVVQQDPVVAGDSSDDDIPS